jgi:2,3-dihydroxy-p-cumate/2,3-dihydroxybenzoate 3,4-dioxygenase
MIPGSVDGGIDTMKLRSVELEVPRADAAVQFLSGPWGLIDAGRSGNTAYLRGTGEHPYVMAITEAASPALACVTFSGALPELERVKARAKKAGIAVTPYAPQPGEPGAPKGFKLSGPEGQVFRFVTDWKPAPRI